MVRECLRFDRLPQRDGLISPTAREDQDARSLEARIIRLEADVSALTQDRRWLMQVVAGLAIELEELR